MKAAKSFIVLIICILIILTLATTALAFGHATDNPVIVHDTEFIMDGTVLREYIGSGGKVVIPEGVTEIFNNAFAWNNKVTEVVIPDSVTRIGMNAFYQCTGLKNIAIPNSVTTIEGSAFDHCTALKTVKLGNGIKRIENYTFQYCESLQSINIPSSVTSIGSNAFRASGLTGIVIPGSVKRVETYAFFASNLITAELKDGVEAIEDGAFDCYYMKSIRIPASVTKIAKYAVNPGAGGNVEKGLIIGVPGSAAQAYAKAGFDYANVNTGEIKHREYRFSASENIAYASTQTVNVDGTPVTFQMYAIRDARGGETNYIKVRDLALILNGTKAQFAVDYDGAVNLVSGKAYRPVGSEMSTPFSGNRTYQKPAGTTKVNGLASGLDAILLLDNNGGGYTYYKLRDLGQALGFNVGWSKNAGVFLETNKPYDPNN